MFFKLKSKTKQKQKKEYRQRMVSYNRIQFWLEFRIGNMSRIDPEKLHERLLQGVENEKMRIRREGLDPKICNGLEIYIKTNIYRKMLENS